MIIDTNILINFSIKDYIKLSESELNNNILFANLKNHQRIIPSYIIAEYSLVMQRVIPMKFKLNKNETVELIEGMKDLIKTFEAYSSIYHFDEKTFLQSLDLYNKLDTKKIVKNDLSLNDLILIIFARKMKHEILSNDSVLVNFSKNLIV